MWAFGVLCIFGSCVFVNCECITRYEFENRLLEITLRNMEDVSALKREMNHLRDANVVLEQRIATLEKSIPDTDKAAETRNAEPNTVEITQVKLTNETDPIQNELHTYQKTDRHTEHKTRVVFTDPMGIKKNKESSESETGTKWNGGHDEETTEIKPVDPIHGMKPDGQLKRYLLGDSVPMHVAFSVAVSDSIGGLGKKQTIHFNKVITNLGNAFDTRLAAFTAPVSGWYAFSITLMARPNESQELFVVKDGQMVFRVYASGSSYTTDSKTMVLQVNKGEEVWVQTTTGSTSDEVHGYEYTTFTGFLLYTADGL